MESVHNEANEEEQRSSNDRCGCEDERQKALLASCVRHTIAESMSDHKNDEQRRADYGCRGTGPFAAGGRADSITFLCHLEHYIQTGRPRCQSLDR
jgi:hypothetical protein